MGGWIDYNEFEIGMERIQFEGDAELIFKGLDTGGQGRLWRHELECLKMMSPESHAHPEYSPLVFDFKSWVQTKYNGDSQRLLWDLGCRTGRNASITVRSMSE